MKNFMDKDFLLESETAKILFHDYAAGMPIIDYHCHINPAVIAEDRRYENITQVWLGGDHYKWRAMRCNGIPESEITGSKDSDPWLTFLRWAETLPKAIGNPLYHWTHLELQRYFGIYEPLTAKNAREIYERCNERLREPDMSVRGIIKQSNVKLICTTDDPVDDLGYHKKLAADPSCGVTVLPAFRPDKAMNADKPGFADYMKKLGEVCGYAIDSFADLKRALSDRIAFFADMGCRTSDHALDYCICESVPGEELDSIYKEALKGQLEGAKADAFKTAVLLHLAREYSARGWVMQIHFGCLRNISTASYKALGPDTGFDAMHNSRAADKLAGLLDEMQKTGSLPKMILYSLNQYDNEIIATIAGAFQTDGGVPGKIQLGSAWWFNDTKTGMEKQLTDLGNLGILGTFVGMLTDSRSFLSYTRHEYFRRILCNLFGKLVENGEYPCDMEMLGGMVRDISYNNTAGFFNFKV